jgi:hypothetical protein
MTEDDFRRLVRELPEAVESAHHDHPDFRVRNKMFATLWPKRNRANVRLSAAEAHALVSTEPHIYTLVSDREPIAWVGISLAAAKPADVAELLEEAWRLRAPAELISELDG